MKLIVESVKFEAKEVQVTLNTCDDSGKRDWKGWATLPAADVKQYVPGEVYELQLTLVQEPAQQETVEA